MFVNFKRLQQALRTTPLRLMVFTQAFAIASLLTVLLTADRYQRYFTQEAVQLLGADLVLNSDREPDAHLLSQARNLKLNAVTTVSFSSVVVASEKQALASVKAVSDGYPLRGKLSFKRAPTQEPSQQLSSQQPVPFEAHNQQLAPAQGTVWVDEALLDALGVKLGDTVVLGRSQFKVVQIIDQEPDRGVQFINFAPRLMLNHGDLAATQLLLPGSRATYRWQFSGQKTSVLLFEQSLKKQLIAGQRLETLEEGRPEMRTTLDRATRFLSLVAILTTLIAACGLALVAHVWTTEQTQYVALLRTLGATRRAVLQRIATVVLGASVLGLVLGILMANILQAILAYVLQQQEQLQLPSPSLIPYVQAFVLLVVLVCVCVVPPVLKVVGTHPMSILRANTAIKSTRSIYWVYILAIICVGAMFMWVAASWRVGGLVLLGLLGVLAVLFTVLWFMMRLATTIGRTSSVWVVRTASRGLLRSPLMTLVQASTLSLALLGVLTMAVLQADVLNAWQNALPKNAPNHFLLNIQPDQVPDLTQQLQAIGVQAPVLMPMVRARLVSVNGRDIGPNDVESERAKRLLDREFNMSYLNDLPAGNTVVQGRWDMQSLAAVSMEQGIMDTLGLKLGDRLRFDVAGQMVELTINSVRTLRWESLNVNFFAIAAPAAMKDMPQTYISSIRAPENVVVTSLVKQFPNLTVLDVRTIANQAQSVLDKVTGALQLLFGLAVIAGLLVLAVVSYASRVLRQREAVLLRVMGASTAQVRNAVWLELAVVGAIAGGLAGLMAYGLVLGATHGVLELPVDLSLWPVYVGAVLGGALNVLGGMLVLFKLKQEGLAQRLRHLTV